MEIRKLPANYTTSDQASQPTAESVEDIEVYPVEDLAGDHYQVVRNGWVNDHWYYGVILHIDIRNGKVRIQHDGIEDGVAPELVEMGSSAKPSC